MNSRVSSHVSKHFRKKSISRVPSHTHLKNPFFFFFGGFPSDPAREDYITARVASFLGIDLTALDPDGIGEEGGMFRLNVFGAALPTLFGVWWDTRRFVFLFG